MNVAVIGASDNPERYSNMAVKLLKEKGHTVFPVHQRIKSVEGLNVFPTIMDVPGEIDTISLYVAANISTQIADEILDKQPRRIIFNPGAENPELNQKARNQHIITQNACTLVLLRTGQF
jgi:predicted CoA-binding protein